MSLSIILIGSNAYGDIKSQSPISSSAYSYPMTGVSQVLQVDDPEQAIWEDPKGLISLNLEEIINLTLQRNRSLLNAVDTVTISHYSLISAESDYELKITPAGSVSVYGGSEEDNSDLEIVALGFSQKFIIGTRVEIVPSVNRDYAGEENYETGIGAYLTQPLLRGLSVEYNLSEIKSAEFRERSSWRSLYLSQVNTMIRAIQNVYDIIRFREILRLNDQSSQRLQGYAEAARIKEKIGLASPIDVYRAELSLNQAIERLNINRESYRDALDNLKLLMAVPMQSKLEVTADLEYKLISVEPEKAIEIAFNNRLEIEQAKDNVSEAKRLSRVAKHNILPEFNLELNYQRYGEDDDFNKSMSFDDERWKIGFAASGDIYRTSEKAQYQQSLLSVSEEQRNFAETLDKIQREVQIELRNLQKNAKSIEIQKKQIHDAEGKLKLSKIKFAHGLADNFDLIESENELLEAQSQLLGAVTNYIIGTYRLKAVLGTLLEKPPEWKIS